MDVFQTSNLIEIRVSQLTIPLFGIIQRATQNGIEVAMMNYNRPLYMLSPGTLASVSILGAEGIYCFDTIITSDQVKTMTLHPPQTIRRLQRRRFPRKPCDLEVIYRAPGGQGHQGRCLDISAGGMRLVTQEQSLDSSDLELEVALVPHEEPLRVVGEVVRSQSVVQDGTPLLELGIRFIRISSSDHVRLIHYINS